MNDELKIKNNELGGKMNYRYRNDEEMKDSGVEWLGSIPNEWNIKKLKYLAKIDTGNRDTQDKEENGIYPFFVRSDTIERSNTYSFDGEAVLTAGDGVGVAKVFHYINGKFAYHQRVYKISDFKQINGKYLYYYIKDNLGKEVEKISAKTTVDSLRLPMFLNFPVLINEDGGKKISEFLDKKTAQFDSIISKKEALIEKLEEAKKSLISEVVTGKVKVVKTDDGYKLVERKKEEMKDSGVEWLGDIPKEWIRKKLKYNCYIKGRIGWQGLKQSEFIDEGPYLITGMNFKNGVINWSEVYHISEERYQEAPEIHLKLGDVLITKDGTIGKLLFIDYLPGKASLNSHLLVMRPLNNDFLPKFLYYSLDASYFKEYVEQVKTGTTFFGITQESISNFNLLIPSLDEQKIVIEYLDERLKILNEIIYKVKYEITKIKEAKKSLISEAVTGKIEILD